jgi:hypothetical protein
MSLNLNRRKLMKTLTMNRSIEEKNRSIEMFCEYFCEEALVSQLWSSWG